MQLFCLLLKTCAIFLHWDRQLSWWFYAFEWDMEFWYTEIGSFHDDFMFLNDWHNFYTEMYKPNFQMIFCLEQDTQFLSGGYLAFSWYPIKQTNKTRRKKPLYSTNRCSMLPLARNNRNLKIANNWLMQKFCDGDSIPAVTVFDKNLTLSHICIFWLSG